MAHWWDEEDVLRSALIALPKLYGAHTGANIGKAIIDTLDLYNIMVPRKWDISLSTIHLAMILPYSC